MATTDPKPSAEIDLSAMKQRLTMLTTQVMYASENGLFHKLGSGYKNKIDDAINRAETALEKKDVLAADAAIYEAKRRFDEAWNSAPRTWLTFFERGWMHHLFTFLGAGMATFVLWALWQRDFCDIHKSSALFGMLGALVRCLYWTTFKANQRMLRRVWAAQNFFAPLIGLILGCVADFILRSSLIVISDNNSEPNIYMSGILVFYAGYNWEWILGLLHKAASHVKMKGNDAKDPSTARQ